MICLLGSGQLGTQIVAKQFDDAGINYSLLLIGSHRGRRGRLERALTLPSRVYGMLNAARFAALPSVSVYKYRKVLEYLRFRRGKQYKNLIAAYAHYTPRAIEVLRTPDVNHVRTLRVIEERSFEIGVLADVAILDENIVNAFRICCLNAHPAPLPDCRGGGALQNTLFYGLRPAVSVHYVTGGIDEGDILRTTNLEMEANDSFESITLKLAMLGGHELAQVTKMLSEGRQLDIIKNTGKLHYWRDCNLHIQKTADRNLSQILRGLRK